MCVGVFTAHRSHGMEPRILASHDTRLAYIVCAVYACMHVMRVCNAMCFDDTLRCRSTAGPDLYFCHVRKHYIWQYLRAYHHRRAAQLASAGNRTQQAAAGGAGAGGGAGSGAASSHSDIILPPIDVAQQVRNNMYCIALTDQTD